MCTTTNQVTNQVFFFFFFWVSQCEVRKVRKNVKHSCTQVQWEKENYDYGNIHRKTVLFVSISKFSNCTASWSCKKVWERFPHQMMYIAFFLTLLSWKRGPSYKAIILKARRTRIEQWRAALLALLTPSDIGYLTKFGLLVSTALLK